MALPRYLYDEYGNVVNPGQKFTKQYPWANAGSITAVVAAGEAPIDDDKRADADVVALVAAKKVIYTPDDGTIGIAVRFRANGSEGDALAIQMLYAAGVDHYTKLADLTCTQGTQDGGSTEHFIDAIAKTNDDWPTPIGIITPEADYMAWMILNTHGNDRFLWVVTDIKAATNVYVDVRRIG